MLEREITPFRKNGAVQCRRRSWQLWDVLSHGGMIFDRHIDCGRDRTRDLSERYTLDRFHTFMPGSRTTSFCGCQMLRELRGVIASNAEGCSRSKSELQLNQQSDNFTALRACGTKLTSYFVQRNPCSVLLCSHK